MLSEAGIPDPPGQKETVAYMKRLKEEKLAAEERLRAERAQELRVRMQESAWRSQKKSGRRSAK
jgi:hypothetical protein